ncbi:glucose PTS transporter subunit IIA [Corynebacterium choanae]|uniref:PTS system beta-glucoside-specific EIIBCA component n=1 Tax=Corynebacterium choanae TaxID=1862358 RepID=A0A3G6J4E0_9CORY|nr:PTS glucose transporter subunit IIABC [Corynebacterium choanae]AZA12799.1 PTS system beta-glucoside-specific EIIBCA component [Corynebacterium choanae]
MTDNVAQLTLLSPAAGTIIPITDVPDKVFASKGVGDGFGVSHPASDTVVAPMSGKITMVAKTVHAIGIRTDDGVDLLVHLGIDTVELGGASFTLTVARGDVITAGDPFGTMDTQAIVDAGKDTTIVVAVTNSKKRVDGDIALSLGQAAAAAPVAQVAVLPKAAKKAAAPVAATSAGTAVATTTDSPAPAAQRPSELTGFDALAWDIINLVGGKSNVKSVTHCITRERFYLHDESKADDAAIAALDGVIDVVKAGGQYQVVIGPDVEDVYDAIVAQLGDGAAGGDAPAESAPRPDSFFGWIKWGFSSLIGVITGSMIPIIGLLAASGIIKGILSLLTTFDLTTNDSNTYQIINAMSDSVFFFLPIFVGFTAAKRLGADPIIVAIIGGVLTHPSIITLAGQDATGSVLSVPLNGDFFGLPINIASYSYSIFPIIVAAWVASKVEPWLKRIIPNTVRMIFVPLLEVVIVSLAILLLLGPIVMLISGGIANSIQWLYDLSPTISGLFIGGFYQVLVIFGLHWAVIPLVAQDIANTGHSYLNAIISATMVAQGGAVLAIFVKSKIDKIKGLAGPAAISAFCGVTEPAMYGLNLKYGRVFIMASIGGAAGGLLTGLFNVNMWGFTGSLIGFTSFVNPEGLDFSFWGFLIASGVALVVSFTLTYLFGFTDADVEQAREVKKIRLGNREPVAK